MVGEYFFSFLFFFMVEGGAYLSLFADGQLDS